mmetsp:Transcript_29311/g.59961  ORF Transcript_29311/g.59961 Transcript_29311/m.59961 type:complete len:275 (-) Transcript_29311:568-1392(-)
MKTLRSSAPPEKIPGPCCAVISKSKSPGGALSPVNRPVNQPANVTATHIWKPIRMTPPKATPAILFRTSGMNVSPTTSSARTYMSSSLWQDAPSSSVLSSSIPSAARTSLRSSFLALPRTPTKLLPPARRRLDASKAILNRIGSSICMPARSSICSDASLPSCSSTSNRRIRAAPLPNATSGALNSSVKPCSAIENHIHVSTRPCSLLDASSQRLSTKRKASVSTEAAPLNPSTMSSSAITLTNPRIFPAIKVLSFSKVFKNCSITSIISPPRA